MRQAVRIGAAIEPGKADNLHNQFPNMPEVKLGGVSLYYEVHGKGAPLLLIGGLGSDSSSWSGVIKGFSPYFQTVVFDNRGSGRSGIARRGCTVGKMAEDAIKLLDSLRIGRAHVIGHSMGGYIAQELAINYPDRVGKLILESTALVSSRRNNLLFEDMYGQLLREGCSAAWIRRWTFWLFSPRLCADGSFIAGFIRDAMRYPYVQKAEGFKSQIGAIASFDARERLGVVRAETLVLEGRDDILITPGEARLLAEGIRKSAFRLLDGVAHCIHIENPGLFTDAVLDFLGS